MLRAVLIPRTILDFGLVQDLFDLAGNAPKTLRSLLKVLKIIVDMQKLQAVKLRCCVFFSFILSEHLCSSNSV